MPIDLDELDALKIAPIVTREKGGVDWDQLLEALCDLGLGEDGTGFSVNDVHKLTRKFATVEFDPEGYPITRQRVYNWVTKLYKDRHAVLFTHPNAANYRYGFQRTRLEPDGKHKSIAKLIYQG